MKSIDIIVCTDEMGGIGLGQTIPWRLKNDMKWFKEKTIGEGKNCVIMGRKTWESLPPSFRPLPHRKNIVISSNAAFHLDGDAELVHSVDEAILKASNENESVFIIGGANLYRQTINSKFVNRLWLTRLQKKFECDVFFPNYEAAGFHLQKIISEGIEDNISYQIELWQK